MRLFGWSGKFYFPKIEIRWPKKKAFDHGNAFTLLFSLQSISGKWERERERARASAREEKIQSGIASSCSSPRSRAPAPVRDRDRADLGAISWRRDRDRTVDRIVIVISDRDRVVIAIALWSWSRRGLCFPICVFLLLFQTPENIFRNIFWNATKHMKTFSFSRN